MTSPIPDPWKGNLEVESWIPILGVTAMSFVVVKSMSAPAKIEMEFPM